MASIVERRVERDNPLSRNAPLVAAAIAAIGILLVHADTVASIVAIWWRSETFAHGFVVVPIALWLAWRKRAEIAAVPARPWYPALLIVALMGALWLASVAAEAIGIRQFALAFMVQAAIVAVVGLGVARSAAFPLLFLLFAVPAGEFLLPILIDWTADFTVWALRATGVPVFREANHFVIPSGNWSVVEACSGLRYLIASLMIGVVYAAVSYRSPARRAAFIAASVVVPIIANWLRAYMIVMIGHLSDNELAVGVDHIIYGWIFFGVVMALLFWVGSFWAEPDAPTPATAHAAASTTADAPSARFFVAAAVAIALQRHLEAVCRRRSTCALSGQARAAGPCGRRRLGTHGLPDIGWTPGFSGEAARLRQGFRAVRQRCGPAGLLLPQSGEGARTRDVGQPPRAAQGVSLARGRLSAGGGPIRRRRGRGPEDAHRRPAPEPPGRLQPLLGGRYADQQRLRGEGCASPGRASREARAMPRSSCSSRRIRRAAIPRARRWRRCRPRWRTCSRRRGRSDDRRGATHRARRVSALPSAASRTVSSTCSTACRGTRGATR